ncbi:hypothetical protein [Vitiosangium sp. GDMCC 1.1324]|uniref:hypothetical protein n=1 Tax=Vitiosangium sp. (strain GDMCC 1.1324) TaxID=2138576 RepID=UPI000D37C9AE|nr:hypothetical protein [Vitiosangium sp. GDMCC 1.1324]PTL75239.1 hypothetical protein DAT35_55875 [Vitiosangium sp. GDMCC 1.1324]
MGSASPGAAVGRLDLVNSLLRAVDRPAREALDMARRPLAATLAPALLGIFLVAATSAAAGFVSPEGPRFAPRLDALRAIFEALLVVIPGTLVFAIYLRLRLSTRVLLAATSIGLLAAGLVATCVMPLMAFLVLVSKEAPLILSLPTVFVPGLALATLAALPVRVITSLDSSRAAWWMSRAFAFFLGAVFLLRIHTFLLHLS